MKQKLFTIAGVILCMGTVCMGQGTVKIDDLKIPVSPAFSLLDISPNSIERPTNPKALSVNVLNYIGSGSALPKNFALEFAPYWVLRQKNETVYKFMGIKPTKGDAGLSSGFLRKLDVSAASYFNDSASNFLKQTNYTGFGIRTNIITYWGVERADEARDILLTRAAQRKEVIKKLIKDGWTADQAEAELENIRSMSQPVVMPKPLFVLDGAYAYSDAYFANKYENKRFNRSAFWFNGNLNLTVNKEQKDYFFVTASYRNMRDNILADTALNIFREDRTADVGIRAGYESGLFSFSVEHISRKYKDAEQLDSKRTVGILQFRVSDNVYLFGTFGKNFGNFNNLFTLFGINWGWGKNNLPM